MGHLLRNLLGNFFFVIFKFLISIPTFSSSESFYICIFLILYSRPMPWVALSLVRGEYATTTMLLTFREFRKKRLAACLAVASLLSLEPHQSMDMRTGKHQLPWQPNGGCFHRCALHKLAKLQLSIKTLIDQSDLMNRRVFTVHTILLVSVT